MLPLTITGEVFASQEATVFSGLKETAVFAAAKSSSGAPSDAGDDSDKLAESDDSRREKQKVMDDVNAFLIESYKIKLDKILEGVYRSVQKAADDNDELQIVLLNRVLSEIRGKTQVIADRNISANRKKILLSVFSYLESDIQSKIRSLSER